MSVDLCGVAVAVTRPREQSRDLVRLIESHGGAALLYPLIEIAAPTDGDALRRAAAQDVDALVFTSANGVRAYLAGRAAGTGTGELCPPAICVGSQTAAAAKAAGITVLATPRSFASDQLAQIVLDTGLAKRRILLVRGNLADKQLVRALRELDCDVVEVVGYRTTGAPEEARRLVADAQAGRVDVLTFASGSAVTAFAETLGGASLPAGVLVASIGPKTTAVLLQHAIRTDVTAAAATTDDLVAALRQHIRAHKLDHNL